MKNSKKINIAINIGATIEYFDFVLFLYMMPIISDIFFIKTQDESFISIHLLILFITNIFAKIFGSFYFGIVSIKIGNKFVMQACIYLMALSTFAIGISPTYEKTTILASLFIIILRFTQSIAFAIEIPSSLGYVFTNFKSNVPLKIASIISSATLGSIIASFSISCLYYFFTIEEIYSYAWRIPFILGGILAFVGIYLRRFPEENINHNQTINMEEILTNISLYKKNFIESVILLLLPASMITTYIYLPKILFSEFSIPLEISYNASTFGLVISIISAPICGIMISRFGKDFISKSNFLFLIFYPSICFALYENPKIIFIFMGIYQFFLTNFMVTNLFKIKDILPCNNNVFYLGITYNLAFIICGFIPAIFLNNFFGIYVMLIPLVLIILIMLIINEKKYVLIE